MRVYGSSPLYNYVELVFRSKRLFIVSVVLTTLVVATMAAMRAGTYTASAIIVLSGSANATQGSEQAAQRGSVRYKLNVLNVVAKDPTFFKDAFRDAGLAKNKTDEQFEDFAQAARKALKFGMGENVLEITCQWRDPQAQDIIEAFYDAYARRVLSLETALSNQTTKVLEALQTKYDAKVKALQDKLIAYQKEHVGGDMLTASSVASQKYDQQIEAVKALQNQLDLARASLQEIERQLANTPKEVEDYTVYESAQRSPQFAAQVQTLYNQRTLIETQLEEANKKYTPEHPVVKQLTAALKALQDRINIAEKPASMAKKPTNAVNRRVALNPTWLSLSARQADMDITIQHLEMQMVNALKEKDAAFQKAKNMPDEIRKYQTMTENLPLYSSIKENLSAKLEQARIDEERDEQTHLKEMEMIVKPVAEPEDTRRSMIFYAAGPILGLLIAFAFSLLAETLDHSLRTPVEVEKYLGKPVLAVLPRMDMPKSARARLGSGGDNSPPSLPST